MYYSIKNVINTLGITKTQFENILFPYQLMPLFYVGHNFERYFSIYQIEILKEKLENKANCKLEFDYRNECINAVFESKINNLKLNI